MGFVIGGIIGGGGSCLPRDFENSRSSEGFSGEKSGKLKLEKIIFVIPPKI